jgi:hypothetical protein
LEAARFTSEIANGGATEVWSRGEYGDAGWSLWRETLQAIADYYSRAGQQPRDDPYDIDCAGQLSDGSLLYLLGTWGMWGSGAYFSGGQLFPAFAGEDASGRILVSDWSSRRISYLSDDMAQLLQAFQRAETEDEKVKALGENRDTAYAFLRSWLPSSAGMEWQDGDSRPSFAGDVLEFPIHFAGAEALFEFWRCVGGTGPVGMKDAEICALLVTPCGTRIAL